MQVHDLGKNPLAIVPLGQAKIKTGYIRIIHPININNIEEVVLEINKEVQKDTESSPLNELIKIRNTKLFETFQKLTPIKRSNRGKRWDTIGKVWKWIAGSPDADDLRLINTTSNDLITQNNKQILINQQIGNRIQEVTTITNNVLNTYKTWQDTHIKELQQLVAISNIDSLIDQVETLEEAILMAKHGIPSSKLLSIKNFNEIYHFLKKQRIQLRSFEELLSISSTQVMMNSSHILYILKVPKLSNKNYEYIYVDSMIRNKKRILIESNFLVKNDSHVFDAKQPCVQSNKSWICERSSLETTSQCIRQLLSGNHSECTYERVYSNGIIKQINDGTVLINDAIIELTSNCSNYNQMLNGSYLIQFDNCQIRINGESYYNAEMELKVNSAYHPTTGQLAYERNIIESPSEEYLQNLTLEHRDKLQTLHLESNSLTWKINFFSSISSAALSIIFGIMIYIYLLNRKTIKIKIPRAIHATTDRIELQESSAPPEINLTQDDKERNYINTPSAFRLV